MEYKTKLTHGENQTLNNNTTKSIVGTFQEYINISVL